MKTHKILKIALALGAVSILLSCQNEQKLPILSARLGTETKIVEGKEVIDTVYKTVANWAFYNQDSVLIDQNALKGKIFVTDFFFTSCSTICPTMHRNLKTVYDKYQDNPDVAYLSHTIDFKYDKPARLKKYAQKLGVDTKKWLFVWGEKDKVYPMAEKEYLVAVQEDSTATDGYIHQGWLVLVDKQGRLRGAYDGTKTEEVAKLSNDIGILLAEYKKK